MPQAFGFFLTLVFRLRIIERMLLEMTGPYWKRQRVRALESVRGLPDVFWTDVATLAGLLQLQGVLALDFSGLRHASVDSR
jgi:hypothetical protein